MLTETVLTFAQAARRLPQFGDRHVSPSTIWRWARKGVRGVKLETRMLGGRFVTSVEALDRFSKAVAEVDIAPRPRPLPQTETPRADAHRERAIARAEARMAAAIGS